MLLNVLLALFRRSIFGKRVHIATRATGDFRLHLLLGIVSVFDELLTLSFLVQNLHLAMVVEALGSSTHTALLLNHLLLLSEERVHILGLVRWRIALCGSEV